MTYDVVRSIRENQLNTRETPFLNCGKTRTDTNSSDNEIINKMPSTSKLFVNNVSGNQIVPNSLAIFDKTSLSTISFNDGDDQNENDQHFQFSSTYDKNNNDYICLYELLSGFPDVS